jgi:hypothetical protein
MAAHYREVFRWVCMSQLPTAPVTLLFTDIEVSTLLLQQPGEYLASVLIEYRDLLRTAYSEYHGYEFDTQGMVVSSFLRVPEWVFSKSRYTNNQRV